MFFLSNVFFKNNFSDALFTTFVIPSKSMGLIIKSEICNSIAFNNTSASCLAVIKTTGTKESISLIFSNISIPSNLGILISLIIRSYFSFLRCFSLNAIYPSNPFSLASTVLKNRFNIFVKISLALTSSSTYSMFKVFIKSFKLFIYFPIL